MPTDLLEEHRDLDGTEPEPTIGFRKPDHRPALLAHRSPERMIETTAGVDDDPNLRRRCQPVEELPRPALQRDLIVREIEIHPYRSAPGSAAPAAPDARPEPTGRLGAGNERPLRCGCLE